MFELVNVLTNKLHVFIIYRKPLAPSSKPCGKRARPKVRGADAWTNTFFVEEHCFARWPARIHAFSLHTFYSSPWRCSSAFRRVPPSLDHRYDLPPFFFVLHHTWLPSNLFILFFRTLQRPFTAPSRSLKQTLVRWAAQSRPSIWRRLSCSYY